MKQSTTHRPTLHFAHLYIVPFLWQRTEQTGQQSLLASACCGGGRISLACFTKTVVVCNWAQLQKPNATKLWAASMVTAKQI